MNALHLPHGVQALCWLLTLALALAAARPEQVRRFRPRRSLRRIESVCEDGLDRYLRLFS